MVYFLLFVLEIVVLWWLSRAVNSRFIGLLPTPLFVLFFLPGTFLHELSHFVAAKLLLVHVGKFSLVPKKKEKEIVLGSVTIAQTGVVRRIIIGSAPVILGLAIILGIAYLSDIKGLNDWRFVALIIYLVFVVANTMFSSKRDLEGAWKVLVVFLIIAVSAYGLGVRVYIGNEIFKLASLYLIVPIAIDGCVLWALSLIQRLRA